MGLLVFIILFYQGLLNECLTPFYRVSQQFWHLGATLDDYGCFQISGHPKKTSEVAWNLLCVKFGVTEKKLN